MLGVELPSLPLSGDGIPGTEGGLGMPVLGVGICTGEGTEGTLGLGIVAGAGIQPAKYKAMGKRMIGRRLVTAWVQS